jgi:hypothetical protein
MSLYNETDITTLSNNWNRIKSEAEEQKYLMIEPSKQEMIEVHNIICKFVIEKKRKIYGGFGLNLLIKNKNPNDVIYKPNDIPDIDFYSPNPIVDLVELCNILHSSGFKLVLGKEAQHQETYNITVNFLTYCDITYVPKNIYNTMPFDTIEKFTIIHPHYMWIDYLRIFSDPILSYWRIDSELKSFKRFFLLQQYYKMPINKYAIVMNMDENDENTIYVEKSLNEIFKFIINNSTIIVIGTFAYNYFLKESGLLNSKKNMFKLINIPYFELISINYKNDCLDLIDILKNIPMIDSSKLTYHEFYPYFQFTDFSVEICYGDYVICRIYNNNKKCIQFMDVQTIDFLHNTKQNNTIKLASFHTVLLYSMIQIMRAKTQKDDNEKQLYYSITSHLIQMRNYYLDKNQKTMIDDSIFKEFTSKCIGDTIPPDRYRKMIIESRKKKNKRWMFSYEPAEGLKEPETTYLFSNTSGNKIITERNLKLSSITTNEIDENIDDENTVDENIIDE